MHQPLEQAHAQIRIIEESTDYQHALDSARSIQKLSGYKQSQELQQAYVQALLACWQRLNEPTPFLSRSKFSKWKKSPSFQLELAKALTQATEFCRDSGEVFRLTDPIPCLSIFNSPSGTGVQVRRLYADTLADKVHLSIRLDAAVAFANRIARLGDYSTSEHLQVQAANCLLKAATFADTEDRAQQISVLIDRMPLFARSNQLRTIQTEVVEQVGSGIQLAQEELAERLLDKVRECQDFDYAYHFTKCIRELSCYQESAVIQEAYSQALLSCSGYSPGSVEWKEVLAELSCTPDFALNSSSQPAYIAIWRRFCSNSAYKIRPMALLLNFFDLPDRKQFPEVEISLARAIHGTYSSFSKTLKLEWLERLSNFSQFESDNEQGMKLRVIFEEILTSTHQSFVSSLGGDQGRVWRCGLIRRTTSGVFKYVLRAS